MRRYHAALCSACFVAASTTSAQATSHDLRNVFAPGYILQDRNGDDVIDFVHAKIVVPAHATEADVAAAANVAARLGYETSASNLDLAILDTSKALRFDLPLIVIGAQNALFARLPSALRGAMAQLAAGEGAILALPANDTFRAGGIVIVGADATGLVA